MMKKVLFGAVAEAVLSYAIEKLAPADRTRQWLKHEPAALAYQKALARTYITVRRHILDSPYHS